MTVSGFLGRALQDPATGLPNLPYFCMIQDWEERRAARRQYSVRVLRVSVAGGGERVRRALTWRLCQELRSSDLIASDGRDHYRILLTSPDAEKAEAIAARLGELESSLNQTGQEGPTVSIVIELEAVAAPREFHGPCEPCDERLAEERSAETRRSPQLDRSARPERIRPSDD